MKKTIIITIVIFTFITVIAQKDKKATEILDRLTAKTESYKTIEVEFTYKMENPEAGIDESKHGTLLVEGDKYRLTIAGQIVISDGEILWTWLVEDDEVMINFIEDDDETITPSNLLTSYSDNYKSKFVKESVQNGKTVDIIDLTPLQGKTYSKIRIIIDKDKIQLLSFTIYDKNGSTYSYLINKFIPDIEINKSEFTFNPEEHPDVEVVDMR